MTQYFITSTGTEIGKTLITAGLAHQYGFKAFKPLISGVTDTTMAGSDTEILAHAQKMPATLESWNSLSPLRFKAALAPSMAAKLEGKTLNYDHLLDLCKGWLQSHPNCLIEGVGGSFVPLVDDKLVINWIKDLNLPSMMVIGSYLGTISHTLATLEASLNRGITTTRIFVSESAGDDHPDFRDTCAEIARLTKLPVVAVPRLSGDHPWQNLPPLMD